MIAQRIRHFFVSLVLKERSSSKLAFSFCMGVYIAISPFIGFHTIMTFALTWLLSLSLPVTFAVSCLLHNPWTTIPIYGADYMFGEWLLHSLCGLDTVSMNPAWMSFINDTLRTYLGLSHISFWSFMIGGNILALGLSVGLYPIMKRLFARVVEQVHGVAGVQG